MQVETLLENGLLQSDIDIQLPPQMRYSSHTLNLVATSDVEAAVTASVGQYKKVYRSSMAKCSQLWNRVSHSTKAADLLEEEVKLSLRAPGVTRWNSTFDAVRLLLHPNVKAKLPSLMDGLKWPRFKNAELDLLT